MRRFSVADSLRINEQLLLEMGIDLPTVHALRALQDSQQGSAASNTDFQAAIMSSLVGDPKQNDSAINLIYTLISIVDAQNGKINTVQRELQILKQKIDIHTNNKEIKQLQRDVEALKGLFAESENLSKIKQKLSNLEALASWQ